MPKKSVREMRRWELAKYSLQAKVFRSVVINSVILGLVTLVIGLILYSYSLIGQYTGDAFNLARNAAGAMTGRIDTEKLAADVLETYRGLSKERLLFSGTEDYRKWFASAEDLPEYVMLRVLLNNMLEFSEVDDVYVAA